jgi:hypothetical protein
MTVDRSIDLRSVPRAYLALELCSASIAVAAVIAAAPLFAALLLADGVFQSWDAVYAACIIILPLSVPVAFLVGRWIFRVSLEQWPFVRLSQLTPRKARWRTRHAAAREQALQVPRGALAEARR